MPQDITISSAQMWISSGITAVVDAAFILLLAWRIKPALFREMRLSLVLTAAVFWGLFGLLLVSTFWNDYYRYFYPGWLRSGGILVFVPVLFGVLALAYHWLSLRMRSNPLLIFCLLAGVEALLEHISGFYGFKILQVPMLQQTSAASILAFSFPEYIFYWCIIISLAALSRAGWRRIVKRRNAGTKAAG